MSNDVLEVIIFLIIMMSGILAILLGSFLLRNDLMIVVGGILFLSSIIIPLCIWNRDDKLQAKDRSLGNVTT